MPDSLLPADDDSGLPPGFAMTRSPPPPARATDQELPPGFSLTRSPTEGAVLAPDGGALQSATEFTKGVGRGIVGTAASAARGVADIGELGYRRLTGNQAPDLGISSTASRAEEDTRSALAPAPGHEERLS